MSRPNNFKRLQWTVEEIDRLREAIKKHKGNPELIMPLFPNRSIKALHNIAVKYKLGTIHSKAETRYTKKGYNPNPVTKLTRILVHNYYKDDMRKGMTHDAAIKDICSTLNRSEKQVKRILERCL